MKRMKPTAANFSRANAECQENIDETEKDLTEMFFSEEIGKNLRHNHDGIETAGSQNF